MTDQTQIEFSKQPRLTEDQKQSFYTSTLRWAVAEWEKVPAYKPDSRTRDKWLSEFWKLEPHLAGIVMSAVSIDVNRGWTLTGGRNQVLRFSPVLHGWRGFPDVYGYRAGSTLAATNFYTTDLGAVVELGREFEFGPVRALYHVDATKCKLSGKAETPLNYYPRGQRMQSWGFSDYLRISSMPYGIEEYNGLGFCAISRALSLAQIMIAVFEHDKESLGAKAPRGLLLIQGIDESSFETAMELRKAKADAEGWTYFQAVAVLASDSDIDAKLVALSQLPSNFDLETFISLLIYGYSLCFGYDAAEFYPVRYGGLSRSGESDIQHQKASGKGAKNFVFSFQDAISRPDIFPPTILFEYDERDDDGEISAATVVKTWTEAYQMMRTAGDLSAEHIRILLAEKGFIPESWTEFEEDVTVSDTETTPDDTENPNIDEEGQETPDETQEEITRIIKKHKRSYAAKRRLRERLLSKHEIMRAAEQLPNESIVRFSYPKNTIDILWESGADLLKPMFFPVTRQVETETLYESDDVTITEEDVNRAVASARKNTPEFAELLEPENYVSES